MQKEIVLGKKYEVKPAAFHRNIVGVAKALSNGKIVFKSIIVIFVTGKQPLLRKTRF